MLLIPTCSLNVPMALVELVQSFIKRQTFNGRQWKRFCNGRNCHYCGTCCKEFSARHVGHCTINVMAYLRDLKLKCDVPTCKAKAVVELLDRWNGVRGQYCRKCGAKQLRNQKLNEGDP